MTPVPNEPQGYSEREVRSLVARVVDGILGSDGETGEAESEARFPAPRQPPSAASGSGVAIGADHGGYALKEKLAFKLRESGVDVLDCGTDGPDPVDYPDIAHAVARAVADGRTQWGIIVDGAGIGSAIAANKVPGIRAALAYDLSSARNSREHNHANVLTLGAGLIGDGLAWQIVQEWLAVEWGPGRHARRIAKIDALERTYLRDGAEAQ